MQQDEQVVPVHAHEAFARRVRSICRTGTWMPGRSGARLGRRETEHAAVGFGGASVSLFIDRRFWLGATGPRALYGTASDERSAFATFFTLKAGYGWR